MNKKRILIVSTHFIPHIGGVEIYTRDLSDVLRKQYPEMELAVLAVNTAGAPEYEQEENFSVWRVDAFGADVNPFFSFSQVKRILQQLDIQSLDVIITQCRYYFFVNYLSWRAKKAGVPLVHIEHNGNFMTHANPLIRNMAWMYDKLVSPFVLRRATQVIAISQSVQEFIQKEFFLKNTKVIYGGVELTEWPMRAEKEGTEISLYFCGRLIETKGIFVLLEAFQQIVLKIPEARLVYIGNGEGKENLIQKIREVNLDSRVRVLGALDQKEIRKHFRSASLFINPSYHSEGLQRSLLEAGASGVPIVSTDCDGVNELISHEYNGVLVPQNNVSALAEAVQDLLNNAEAQARYSKHLRAAIEEKFSLEKNSREFYESIT